jgi:hypothetical protein
MLPIGPKLWRIILEAEPLSVTTQMMHNPQQIVLIELAARIDKIFA